MRRYIIRLDDASEYMDVEKWNWMASILKQYGIKPIFGIIPDNQDKAIVSKYAKSDRFWDWALTMIAEGWIPAMHGFRHEYVTSEGGINPVNYKSEFAGLSYNEQAIKIREGYRILNEHGIYPTIFFAPSHTYDLNTLEAIKNESPIRIVSDTVAWNAYSRFGIKFIPVQSGKARRLPFSVATFCYHPNTMTDKDFEELGIFIKENVEHFNNQVSINARKCRTVVDIILSKAYFWYRRLRKIRSQFCNR